VYVDYNTQKLELLQVKFFLKKNKIIEVSTKMYGFSERKLLKKLSFKIKKNNFHKAL
jgi:hypothetical protein